MELVRTDWLRNLVADALSSTTSTVGKVIARATNPGTIEVNRADRSASSSARGYFDNLVESIFNSPPAHALDGFEEHISHYRLLEKIGDGGMGVVFKAVDTRLDRLVALKFLPRYLSDDDNARRRLVLEAKAASAIDHPNVVTVFEIDEIRSDIGGPSAGRLFMAMAYYEGVTLKNSMNSKSLSIGEVVDVCGQVSSGLAAVHDNGIVHRDIKPSNIILTTAGTVKIVDFGLARTDGIRLTKPNTTLGTVAFMSPEQASGGEVDSRTDLWSLGVLLYELLTGKLPFSGEYDAAVIYSIINQPHLPVATFYNDIPEELARVVERCLQKERALRYQSAADVVADLQRCRSANGSNHYSNVSARQF